MAGDQRARNSEPPASSGSLWLHGPKPEVKQFQNMGEIIESVAEHIKKWVDAHVCASSDIAVLYYTVKAHGTECGEYIPRRFGEALERRGILYNWVSQDYRSKKSYDITTDSVTISTIYSAKGFDYFRVFLVGLDHIDPERLSEQWVRSLVYVGITRARYELFVPFVDRNSLIEKLLACV
jgi:superfamily I DNA/RNA helicase